jgi:hypothetical protein
MIITMSVMPTAVTMLSREKRRSSSRIWVIADPKVIVAFAVSKISSFGVGSTLWWISLVAFQTRNRLPTIYPTDAGRHLLDGERRQGDPSSHDRLRPPVLAGSRAPSRMARCAKACASDARPVAETVD